MDLPDLNNVSGSELTETQLQGILAQIDLDLMNLVRDGKLAALKYGVAGPAGMQTDRAANLQGLLMARDHYQQLLQQRPAWITSQALTCSHSHS